VIRHHGLIPSVSPYGLIQELIWPNEWLIIVSCILLNQTSRKQVERIFPDFIKKWQSPEAFKDADPKEVSLLIKSLGFCNRRTKNLFKMTEMYLTHKWVSAKELPGVGEYGDVAHAIFCCGKVPTTPPDDHALKKYFVWYSKQQNETEKEKRAEGKETKNPDKHR